MSCDRSLLYGKPPCRSAGSHRSGRQRIESLGPMDAVFWVLVYVFIVPILVWVVYWGVRLVWWIFRVVLFSALILINLAGRSWRGEL
jgi:hypothetical protein